MQISYKIARKYVEYIRLVHNQLVLLVVINLMFSSFLHGQNNVKKDRIYLPQEIYTQWITRDNIKNLKFIKLSDSLNLLAVDQPRRNSLLQLFNQDGKLVNNRYIKLFNTKSNTILKDIKVDENFIYLLFGFDEGSLLVLSHNLRLVDYKEMSDFLNNDFRIEDLEVGEENVYVSAVGNFTSYLVTLKKDSTFQISGGFKFPGGAVINSSVHNPFAEIESWGDFIYMVCTDQQNLPLPIRNRIVLMKFDSSLTLLNQKQIDLNSGRASQFYFSEKEQKLILELDDVSGPSVGDNKQTLKFDSAFNLLSSVKWGIEVTNTGIINSAIADFSISNRFDLGDREISIYPNIYLSGVNYPWFKRSDAIIIERDSSWNLNFAKHLSVRVNDDPDIRNIEIEGVNKFNNEYQFYIIEDYGRDSSLFFIDIIKYPDSIRDWVCQDLYPVNYDEQSSILPALNNSNYQLLPLGIHNTIQGAQLSHISQNQFQICGPSFDTCSVLDVKILERPDSVCWEDSIRFHIISQVADSFEWFYDGVLVGTLDFQDLIFTVSGLHTLKVKVYPEGSLNCFAEDSIILGVSPAQTEFLSDTTICKGDTTQLSAKGAMSFLWSPSNNLSCNNCSNPIIVTNDSLIFLVTGRYNSICSYTDTFYLNVFPEPKAFISGSSNICPGSNRIWFGLNSSDSLLVNWWIDTVGIITQDFGDSIYTTWPMGIDSAFVYAYVQYPAGCDGDTIRFKVKVNQALEPKIIVNEDSICFSNRENVNYNLTYNTNGSIYLWEIENGQILSGDSTASITVNWDSVGTGKLIVREYSTTSVDTCFGEDSVFIEILPNPENDLQLLGKVDVCLNEDVNYNITVGWLGSTYDWMATGNASLIGQGTETIQTSWDSTGNYLVSVQEISEYGCGGPKDSLEVRVHPIPEPQRVGDDTLLCLGDPGSGPGIDNWEYEVSGFANSTFDWNLEGGFIKNGQGTNKILVTWDSSIIKSLSVIEVSEFGCESDELQIKQYFDLSRLELFVVSVSEDSSISLDFELESLRSYPGDSIWVARRTEAGDPGSGSGIFGDWVRIVRIPKTSTEFSDQSINPKENSFGYRVEGLNTCEQEIRSRDHSSILLNGIRNPISAIRGNEKETIQLNWTAYRNWDGGVKSYELYEKFDSVYVKVAEANLTELIYDPKIPKKEHCFRIRAVQNGEDRDSWSNAFCIELERALNIPNVVTPNGDNKNDKLKIVNLEAYPDHELTIYNRWGQEAFKSTQYNNNWPEDNTISGTYFYRLQIKDEISGMEENYKGWIQVLR